MLHRSWGKPLTGPSDRRQSSRAGLSPRSPCFTAWQLSTQQSGLCSTAGHTLCSEGYPHVPALDFPKLGFRGWFNSMVLKQDYVLGSRNLGGQLDQLLPFTWVHGGQKLVGGAQRARKGLGVTTCKKGSSRRMFPRRATTSLDLSKPRSNGLLLSQSLKHKQMV